MVTLWPADQRSTSSAPYASPPTMRLCSCGSGQRSASIVANAAGVINAWVTRSRSISSAKFVAAVDIGRHDHHGRPGTEASNNSSTAASKLGDARCSVREAEVTPKR